MAEPSPYIVCTASRARAWGIDDIGRGVRWVDPWAAGCSSSVRRIHGIYQRSAAGRELDLPLWALYDCAASTGAIAGLERRGGPDAEPLTMLGATPGALVGDWHCLAWAGDPELLDESLDLALAVVRPARMTAVAPWTGPMLRTLASRGPLELLTAWTPAHTRPESAMVRVSMGRRGSAEQWRDGVERLRIDGPDAMRVAQAGIESGRRARLARPPGADGGAAWIEFET